MKRNLTVFLMMAALLAPAARAEEFEVFLKKVDTLLKRGMPLADSRAEAGIKEALKVAIQKTIQQTASDGGYSQRDSIRIPLPENLQLLEKILRMVKKESMMKELALSMNKAAEMAAPEAREILLAAVEETAIENAPALVSGPDTAATFYFRSKALSDFLQIYRPAIQQAMEKQGVQTQYETLLKRTPLARVIEPVDLENYVLNQAARGIFKMLAEQEKAIRRDPASRSSHLLQEVFQKGHG